MTTQIGSFHQEIQRARQADSARGGRITRSEARQALAFLGAAVDAAAAVRDVLGCGDLTPGARAALQAFVAAYDRLGVSEATLQRMRDVFAAQKDVDWREPGALLPIGVRYERAQLQSDRGADGFEYTALIPTGAIRPSGSPQTDPNLASAFYVERSGGLLGRTEVCGPFPLSAVPQSAAALRALLDADYAKRTSVVDMAFPGGFPKMTPAAIGDIARLDDTTYRVTVDLVNFFDKQVVASASVLVDVQPFKVWRDAPIGPMGPPSTDAR